MAFPKMAQSDGQSGNVLPLPRWTLAIHAVQLLLAVVVLGLAAYGVSLIAYYALIFSIVCCLLTFPICGYIIGTTLFAQKMYNGMIVFVLHCFMALLWLINMGLTANLARIWGDIMNICYSSYSGARIYTTCASDFLTIDGKALRGTLIAGALFAAAELVMWAGSGVLVLTYLNNRRNDTSNSVLPTTEQATKSEAVPLQQQQQPTQGGVPHPGQYSQQPPNVGYEQNQQPQYMQTPQSQYAQPYMPYGQQAQPTGPYAQDPINRGSTVSPVSQAGYSAPAHNTSELATPQHTGHYSSNVSELSSPQHGAGYNPNASELSNHK